MVGARIDAQAIEVLRKIQCGGRNNAPVRKRLLTTNCSPWESLAKGQYRRHKETCHREPVTATALGFNRWMKHTKHCVSCSSWSVASSD